MPAVSNLCPICKKCMHSGDDECVRVIYINNDANHPAAAQSMEGYNVHFKCLKCNICGMVQPECAYHEKNVLYRAWAITPAAIVHMYCHPCAICGKLGRKTQKRRYHFIGDLRHNCTTVHESCINKKDRRDRRNRAAGRPVSPLQNAEVPWR